MMMGFLSFLFLVTVGSATAIQPRKELPPRLLIRGGAGPLDKMMVAKTAVALGGIQGTLNLLCAEKNLEGYGWKATEEAVVSVKGAGWAALASAVMNYQMLTSGDSVQALRSSLMVHLLGTIVSTINEDYKALGSKPEGGYFWLALNGATVYGLSKGADWAIKRAIPVISALAFLGGGAFMWDAKTGLGLYGRNKNAEMPTETALMVESWGAIIAGGAAMMYAHSTGVETAKAIGYGFIPFLISQFKNVFVTKNYQKMNMDTTPFMVWMAVAAVIIGTLSI